MKVIFLGCTNFSKQIFESLASIKNLEILALFTIPEEFSISYSSATVKNTNYFDFKEFSKSMGIPLYEVNSQVGKRLSDYKEVIKELNPDVILVMGWYYMVSRSIRKLAKYGAWGIHASMLPDYAGGAPLVWAIIEGRKDTGVTLFQLSDGVDDGDIIKQKLIPINENDTIKDVYEKATEASIEILTSALNEGNRVKFFPQNKKDIKVYPQRSPSDGLINWNWDIPTIKNFIRAQTKPYPGAWFLIENKKVIIWDADIFDNT